MRAMILAAGRGKRMGELTDHTPKPLLPIKNKPLIVYQIEALLEAGVEEFVINLGYLGHKIESTLGNGKQFGVRIQYSVEDPVLETGGGVAKALPLLGSDPFIVVSSDIYTDYPYKKLPPDPEGLVHLVMVDNPPHHSRGDYALVDGKVSKTGDFLLNFGGIGVYRPELFIGCPEGIFPLNVLYEKAIIEQKISGEYYQGLWHNIGTSKQLANLNEGVTSCK
jgi:MurNAc alpha-1-phosphate uridylyltransferase